MAVPSDDAGRSYPRVAGPDERFIDLTPDVLAGVTPADLTAVLTVVVGAVYYVGARLLEQVWPSARFLLGGPPAPSYVGRHAES